MKKRKLRKLVLQKETLNYLDQVIGGGGTPASAKGTCNTCPASVCGCGTQRDGACPTTNLE